jgi:predicted nucleic acid-binding protein
MADPVYFDSSVFLAIFVGSDPQIKELLKELRRDKIRIYTSIVTIQEVSVQTFRKGFSASDNYTKVNKLARIQGITKEIALTAAKLEAQIIDQTAPKEREDNKRRKWDCFHVATAMELGCRTLYASDEKLLKRKTQFGLAGMDFSKPIGRSLPLLDDSVPPIIVGTDKTNGKDTTEVITDAGKAAPTISGTIDAGNKLETSTAYPTAVQGSDGGRAESETAREREKESTKEVIPKPCECGCGEYPKEPRSRFLPGHDLRKAYNDQKQSP